MALSLVAAMGAVFAQHAAVAPSAAPAAEQTLSARQQAIIPVAAFAAAGDIARLNPALHQALDAGMTVNEAKEVLVQVYAYAGFPRSLNALGELMKVVDARKQRGIQDAQGPTPRKAIAQGDALRAAGTANHRVWWARRSRAPCSSLRRPLTST